MISDLAVSDDSSFTIKTFEETMHLSLPAVFWLAAAATLAYIELAQLLLLQKRSVPKRILVYIFFFLSGYDSRHFPRRPYWPIHSKSVPTMILMHNGGDADSRGGTGGGC